MAAGILQQPGKFSLRLSDLILLSTASLKTTMKVDIEGGVSISMLISLSSSSSLTGEAPPVDDTDGPWGVSDDSRALIQAKASFSAPK